MLKVLGKKSCIMGNMIKAVSLQLISTHILQPLALKYFYLSNNA